MRIRCTQCSTRFELEVPDTARQRGARTLKFRCTHCGSMLTLDKPRLQDEEPEEDRPLVPSPPELERSGGGPLPFRLDEERSLFDEEDPLLRGEGEGPEILAPPEEGAEAEDADDDASALAPGELLLKQDGRTYQVRNLATVQRWIMERRVSREDLISLDGLSWEPVGEHDELDIFFDTIDRLDDLEFAPLPEELPAQRGASSDLWAEPVDSSFPFDDDEPSVHDLARMQAPLPDLGPPIETEERLLGREEESIEPPSEDHYEPSQPSETSEPDRAPAAVFVPPRPVESPFHVEQEMLPTEEAPRDQRESDGRRFTPARPPPAQADLWEPPAGTPKPRAESSETPAALDAFSPVAEEPSEPTPLPGVAEPELPATEEEPPPALEPAPPPSALPEQAEPEAADAEGPSVDSIDAEDPFGDDLGYAAAADPAADERYPAQDDFGTAPAEAPQPAPEAWEDEPGLGRWLVPVLFALLAVMAGAWWLDKQKPDAPGAVQPVDVSPEGPEAADVGAGEDDGDDAGDDEGDRADAGDPEDGEADPEDGEADPEDGEAAEADPSGSSTAPGEDGAEGSSDEAPSEGSPSEAQAPEQPTPSPGEGDADPWGSLESVDEAPPEPKPEPRSEPRPAPSSGGLACSPASDCVSKGWLSTSASGPGGQDLPKAREFFLKALVLAPDNGEAHYGVGYVAHQQGDARMAKRHYCLALDNSTGYPAVAQDVPALLNALGASCD